MTLALFVLERVQSSRVNPLWQDAIVLSHYRKHTSYIKPFVTTTAASCVGRGGRAVERRTVNRGDGGSIPPIVVSKHRQFRSPHICPCLSEKTLKIGHKTRGKKRRGKRSHTWGECVTCSARHVISKTFRHFCHL